MFFDHKAKKYLELALEEQSTDIAKEIFLVGRRCQELASKNRQLKRLFNRAQLMVEHDDPDRTSLAEAKPQNWTRQFETGWTAYIRRTARSIQNFELRRILERGADDVFALEARNRGIRDNLDSVAQRYAGHEGFNEWIHAYRSETLKQKECQCCGNVECCTCERCRHYLRMPSPFSELQADGGAAIETAVG